MKNLYEETKIRLILFKAGLVYTFQIETAYWLNNWGNILSTTIFTITQIVFIDIIYANVTNIAGYSRDEMLLFVIVSQMWFYIIVGMLNNNFSRLISDVNTGRLDLILVKPVPALFYVTFGQIKLLSMVRDGLPPLIVILASINFQNVDIQIATIPFVFIVFICGILCSICIQFIATLPVFWVGEASSLNQTALELEDSAGHLFPLEGWKQPLRTFFVTVLPFGISSGLTTSMLLSRTPIFPMLFVVIIVTLIFLQIRNLIWKIALEHYSSASS